MYVRRSFTGEISTGRNDACPWKQEHQVRAGGHLCGQRGPRWNEEQSGGSHSSAPPAVQWRQVLRGEESKHTANNQMDQCPSSMHSVGFPIMLSWFALFLSTELWNVLPSRGSRDGGAVPEAGVRRAAFHVPSWPPHLTLRSCGDS